MTHPTRIECVDCSRLPRLPLLDQDVDETVEYRPVRLRKVVSGNGPRSWRCASHTRAMERRQKAGRAAARRARVYGVTPELADALWEIQGRACPCGRQPTREPDTDHDHALARGHDHPVEQGCPECVRGRLCRSCNTYVIGRYNADQLRALASYLDDPPMARLLREAS